MCAGRPMVWYSQHGLGFAMAMPAAVAGALLPYLASSLQLRDALLGAALLLSGIASFMTSAGATCADFPLLCSLAH